jgi:hypothetical protein
MTITLVSCGQCIACLSSMSYDYSFGIFWPMYCLSFFDVLWLFLWYLVDNVKRNSHKTYIEGRQAIHCPQDTKGIVIRHRRKTGNTLSDNVLPVFLRCLMIITLVSCGQCIACLSSMSYDYYFGILWTLYCLSFFDVLNRHISVSSFVYKYDQWPHDS